MEHIFEGKRKPWTEVIPLNPQEPVNDLHRNRTYKQEHKWTQDKCEGHSTESAERIKLR